MLDLAHQFSGVPVRFLRHQDPRPHQLFAYDVRGPVRGQATRMGMSMYRSLARIGMPQRVPLI